MFFVTIIANNEIETTVKYSFFCVVFVDFTSTKKFGNSNPY